MYTSLCPCQLADKVKRSGDALSHRQGHTLRRERAELVGHLLTAIVHGFGYSMAGAPLIIADGLLSGDFVEVEIGKKHLKRVRIAEDVAAADSMTVVCYGEKICLALSIPADRDLSPA